jgi:hypothetical protein
VQADVCASRDQCGQNGERSQEPSARKLHVRGTDHERSGQSPSR